MDRAVEPVLVDWPPNWGERRRRRNGGMLWIGVALFAIAAVMLGFSGGAAGPLASGAVLALFALTAFLVAIRRPFGRGRVHLTDTATLMRGRPSPTPDVRVHFVAERPAGATLLILSVVWAVVLSAATVVAVRIGLSGRPQALLGATALGLLAVLFAYGAIRGAVARSRFDSFGRRPVGLAVGPDGVTFIRVAETVHLPWAAIRSVEADVTEPRRGMDQLPLIRLRLDPKRVNASGAERRSSTITVTPAMLQTHPQVIWSALRGFHRSPSSRTVLGTPAGQQQFDLWVSSAEES